MDSGCELGPSDSRRLGADDNPEETRDAASFKPLPRDPEPIRGVPAERVGPMGRPRSHERGFESNARTLRIVTSPATVVVQYDLIQYNLHSGENS